jgi:phage shock protein PspC (stress-responsive transcriptional regulator)
VTTLPVRPSAAPPLLRRRSGRFVAGVAGGIADHLGVRVLWVRVAFALLAVLNGAGIAAYGLLWVFVRQEQADVARNVPRSERQQALGLAALGIAVAFAGSAAGSPVIGWVVGPLGVAAIGAAVVWREADESQRRKWTQGARQTRASTMARVIAGALFVAVGIAVFLLANIELGQLQFAVLAVVATLAGVAVITVPWWLRLMRDLGEERRERIVESERAEIAAHLHDSVLQTLALIQRQSDQPREVLRLARGQERELRTWLYGPTGYGRRSIADPALDSGFTDALTRAAAEVEDTYAKDVRPGVGGGGPAAQAGGAGRSTTGCARCCSLPARRWSTPRSTPAPRRSACTWRWSPRRSTSSCATAGSGSIRTRYRTTATASPTPCTAGWSATAVPSGCARALARAPRCTCGCRWTRSRTPTTLRRRHDHPGDQRPAGAHHGVPRRRPRALPLRGARGAGARRPRCHGGG